MILALIVTSGGCCAATRLGAAGSQFTINGAPTFLLGMSYFSALGAPRKFVRRDLSDLQRLGFNWVRAWATWSAYGSDVSAVDGDGRPRPAYLSELRWFVAECDRRGLIVDVTLSRSAGSKTSPQLAAADSLRRAVLTIVTALKSHPNWYIDLANERNVRDGRYVSFAELRDLRDAVRQADPALLVTASHGGDLSKDELRDYLETARVDIVCPHRPRDAASPAETMAKTLEYRKWMRQIGRVVPVNYQEPFRRGYGSWQPRCSDYLTDLSGALEGGAAGWCLHNGGQQGAVDEEPRRSFDLRKARLFDQLDAEARCAAAGVISSILKHPCAPLTPREEGIDRRFAKLILRTGWH